MIEAQTRAIQRYMEAGNKITQRIASRKFDCDRLGARNLSLKSAARIAVDKLGEEDDGKS